MIKTVKEYSAGGIVFKQPTASSILWLIAKHSYHKGWVFPKGLIGDHKEGETREETAVREVEEETGVKAKILQRIKRPATYFYTWQGGKRFKTVYYFLMEFINENPSKKDEEMSELLWLSEKKVMEKLTFKSDKQAFEEALEIVEKHLKHKLPS